MLKLSLTVLLFPLFEIAFSQNDGAYASPATYTYGEPFENRAINEKSAGSVDGTPLLFSDWQAGEVLLKNGEKYAVAKMNLNAEADKFLFKQHDTVFEFLDNVKEIKIYNPNQSDDMDTNVIFSSNIDPGTPDFVEVLATGKITLFRRYTKKPEGENYSNGITKSTRKYVLHSTDYVIINNVVTPIEKYSSSKLDELTADKKSQVDAWIKANNLKVRKANDFAKAIVFYDSLN